MPELNIGDRVMIDSYEGFGGPAVVTDMRKSPGGRYRVRMDDNNPPEFWAHDDEIVELREVRNDRGSRPATREHIAAVGKLLGRVVDDLFRRQAEHDRSKLESPEVEVFDEYTPKLAACTYGSDEYKSYLAAMKPALDHHYAVNSHHPEHYPAGIRGMSLLDLIEMICDWKAATLRHNDGDIRRSIEINQKRFGYSDELKQIFLNSLPVIEV